MTLEVDSGISVEELKVKVSDFIIERAGRQTLPPDALRLKGDDRGDVKVEGETINITLQLLIRGGGKKVIKHTLKTKATETTTLNNKDIYEQTFLKAVEIHGAQAINVQERIDDLHIHVMKELYDRTPAGKKAESLCELFEDYHSLVSIQHKVASAIERFRSLTVAALEDEDGKFDTKGFVEMVSNRIAVKEAQQDMDL